MIKFYLSIIALAWKTGATMTNITLPGFFCEGSLNPRIIRIKINYDDENSTIYHVIMMGRVDESFIFTNI